MFLVRVVAVVSALAAAAFPASAQASATTAVVEFRVPISGTESEYYRARLTDPEDIETARRIKAGELPRMIPVGRVVRGEADVNKGYTWHLDPEHFQFAPYALSVCNVAPSKVERMAFLKSLCPWDARIAELWISR